MIQLSGGDKATVRLQEIIYTWLARLRPAREMMPEDPLSVLANGRPRARWEMAAKMGRVQGPLATTALVGALADPEPLVRSQAGDALIRLGERVALPPLLDALNQPPARRQAAAADALGRLKVTDAVPALINALRHRDPGVRTSAALALGAIGQADVILALSDLLTDPVPGVRWAAMRALSMVRPTTGDGQALATTVTALGERLTDGEEHWQIRREAARTVARLGAGSSLAERLLICALSDANSQVRWEAATGLGIAGGAGALVELEALLEDEASAGQDSVAMAARRAIERIEQRLAKSAGRERSGRALPFRQP
ncbi:MAG TPA: HEAT repeat domain-containing protein [Anaerolineae bacterium]|nr:HEAT repeat domain-containing protein [Anaerolineae bacterium]